MEYKVLKPELFIAETLLLDKYKLWNNDAYSPALICHSNVFGSKDDIFFGSENSLWFGFDAETNKLTVKCSSYGGMCGFEFTRDTLKEEGLSDIDRECIEYTYRLIDDLKEEGVIE